MKDTTTGEKWFIWVLEVLVHGWFILLLEISLHEWLVPLSWDHNVIGYHSGKHKSERNQLMPTDRKQRECLYKGIFPRAFSYLISSLLDGIAHFQDGTFSFSQLWKWAIDTPRRVFSPSRRCHLLQVDDQNYVSHHTM